MAVATFEELVEIISGNQLPRVWSLLVTVFGDLAQAEGAAISGTLLRQITALIGVKPEATRVALHRLRKEGWIESERIGRNSSYFLTAAGRELSAKATPRIYATEPEHKNVCLVLAETGHSDELDFLVGAWISPTMVLTGQEIESPELFKVPLKPSDAFPEWMAHKVCDTETAALSKEVLRQLTKLGECLQSRKGLSPLERAVLRILIVHSWRRVVLKVPALPDFVFPNAWCGAQCRMQIQLLLAQLGEINLETLQDDKNDLS